jgi:YD repeat-containing protein
VAETDEQGFVTMRKYDDAGNLLEVLLPDPDGAGPLGAASWKYAYDDQGNQTRLIDPRSGISNGTWNPGGRALETLFTYDERGLRLSRTLPDGQSESWTYDRFGRVSSHIGFAFPGVTGQATAVRKARAAGVQKDRD